MSRLTLDTLAICFIILCPIRAWWYGSHLYVCRVYLCVYSVGVGGHTTNLTPIQLPRGAIKKTKKHKHGRKPAIGIHSEDYTTTETQTMRLGPLDRLTDSTVGQGHITTLWALDRPGGEELHSTFYKLHIQQSQHRYSEGDKLKTDRASQAHNKTKDTEWWLFMVARPPSLTPCHLLGVVERRACVYVCACCFYFGSFGCVSPHKNTLRCPNLYCLS